MPPCATTASVTPGSGYVPAPLLSVLPLMQTPPLPIVIPSLPVWTCHCVCFLHWMYGVNGGRGATHIEGEWGSQRASPQKGTSCGGPLPALQACVLEVPCKGLAGHWQVVGGKQGAVSLCTHSDHFGLPGALPPVGMGRGLLHLFPRPAELWEVGRGRALLHHALLQVWEGPEAHGFVSWLNKCWHPGFSLPEWGQDRRGRGKRRW